VRRTGELAKLTVAYHQIRGTVIPKLVDALQSADMAVARRWPRVGGRLEVLRRDAFHGLIAWITWSLIA
jgi:hypothetical protein